MTLDADRRRLERAALTDPGEAVRALGRERLRALATVPLEAQTRALNALVAERAKLKDLGPWNYTRTCEREVRDLLRDAVRARLRAPTWLGAVVPKTRGMAVVVLAARVGDAVGFGIASGTAPCTETRVALGGRRAWRFTWPWPEIDLVAVRPKRRYVPAEEAHARIAAWALRPADDRVLLSLEAAKQWAGPSPEADVFSTTPGGNDRFGIREARFLLTQRMGVRAEDGTRLTVGTAVAVDAAGNVVPMRDGLELFGRVISAPNPNAPTHVSVAVRRSTGSDASLELRLGDRVERRTFPPEYEDRL